MIFLSAPKFISFSFHFSWWECSARYVILEVDYVFKCDLFTHVPRAPGGAHSSFASATASADLIPLSCAAAL